MPAAGVRYVPLGEAEGGTDKLPLAAAWVRGTRDVVHEDMIDIFGLVWRRTLNRLSKLSHPIAG